MPCMREFKERIENDLAFREKFKGVKSENELIARAEAEGYDLTKLCDDDLDNVAGGKKSKEEIRDAFNVVLDILNIFGW